MHRFMKVFVILFFNYRCVWFGNLDNAGFIKWGKQHLLLIFCKDLWKWNYFSLEYLLAFPWWNHVGLESLCVSCKEHRVGSCFFFFILESCDLWFCSAVLAFFFLFLVIFLWGQWEASAWGVLLEYKKLFYFLNFLERHFCYFVSLLFCLLQD